MVCLLYMYVCEHVYMCVCMCTCWWKPDVDIGCLFQLLPICFGDKVSG